MSVDTYKPAVAEAAIAAGAVLVNDVSGLRDPALADVCAATGAALVIMHTRAEPKEHAAGPGRYDGRASADVARVPARADGASRFERGVAPEQIVLDPGPDFGKTPAQTVEVLRALDELRALGRPLLLAVSRKDFLGAITGRPPRERPPARSRRCASAWTPARHVFRVHDVAAAADFIAVRAVLRGEAELAADASSRRGCAGTRCVALGLLPCNRVAGRCAQRDRGRPTNDEGVTHVRA